MKKLYLLLLFISFNSFSYERTCREESRSGSCTRWVHYATDGEINQLSSEISRLRSLIDQQQKLLDVELKTIPRLTPKELELLKAELDEHSFMIFKKALEQFYE